jgi:hypothetical protein
MQMLTSIQETTQETFSISDLQKNNMQPFILKRPNVSSLSLWEMMLPSAELKVRLLVGGMKTCTTVRVQINTYYHSGLAGTILVYKIAGALASRGGSLNQVYSIATWIASRIATIGVSVGHTHVRLSLRLKFQSLDCSSPGTWYCSRDY